MSDRRHALGLALVAVAALLWSTGGLVVRSLDEVDTWTTVAHRSLWASVFLVLFVVVRDRRDAARSFTSMGLAGLVVAVCFAVASVAFVVAVGMTTVANTVIAISTAPLVAAVLGRVVLAEPVAGRTWAAAGATIVGAAVMVSGSSAAEATRVGDAVAFLIPLALATATVTIRRHQHVLMVPAMATGTMIAAAVSLPLAGSLAVGRADLGLLVFFGAGQLGLGLALFGMGARWAPPADVTLVTLIEPVLAPLWVWMVFAEQPGTAALVGGSLVLGALAVHTVVDLRRRTMPVTA